VERDVVIRGRKRAWLASLTLGLGLALTPGCGVHEGNGNADPHHPAAASAASPAPMVLVPAGPFLRGSPAKKGRSDERPQRRLVLQGFEIDQHEVTVRQYKRCVAAGACDVVHLEGTENPGREPFSRDRDCNWGAVWRSDHPINCVSWQQATRFCGWAGKRLPTEAEWEKAARGTDGRAYPWGAEAPTCHRVVMDYGCKLGSTWSAMLKTPYGDSPFKAWNMAGNVAEWVSDWYGPKYYADSPDKDPAGPTSGKHRVLRGGHRSDYRGENLRAAARSHLPAGARSETLGFRCARDAEAR